MTKLKKIGNSFFITNKVKFLGAKIDKKSIINSLDFSLKMSFGEGFHRKHRSGGSIIRNQIEIFSNAFQGKLSEYCVVDFFKKNGINIDDSPDTSVFGKGVWDSSDLTHNSKRINIKSCSFFSNLVLLETKDWNTNGQYIPNLKHGDSVYDYFILVRIKDDIKLMFNNIDYRQKFLEKKIRDKIELTDFYYDIPGYFTTKTLIHIIGKKYIIPKNSLLNGKVKMDADNYYIQSGNLRCISHLVKEL